MAKLSNSEIENIVQRDLPHRRVVSRSTPNPRTTAAEATAPELDVLQRKFGVDSGTYGRMSPRDGRDAVYGTDDDEIVIVELDSDGSNPWKSNNQRKAVIVSGSRRRIIGEQG